MQRNSDDLRRKMKAIFVGIGSNLGSKEENCIHAINEISKDERIDILAVSSLYITAPISPIPQDDFLNCAISLEFEGSPFDLLKILKGIEEKMGRKNSERWGPRVIDLDILLFRDLIIEHRDLSIPHPLLHKRKFALIPCLEIDREIIHPLFKRPLLSFLKDVEDQKVSFYKRLPFTIKKKETR